MKLKFIFFCLACIVALSRCTSIEPSNTGPVDVTTAATPKGEKLRPAENGPIRSVLGKPKIDLDTFELSIAGLVNSPFSLSWEEIQELPTVNTGNMIMYCIENWEVWGDWRGFLVMDLLEEASLQDKAKYVMFHCVDGYSTSLPIDYIKKYDVMLSYEVNGKPLADMDGFPLRLIAFGKYGYKWAKWVNRLEALDRSKKGYWETRGYSDSGNIRLGKRRYYEGTEAEKLDY